MEQIPEWTGVLLGKMHNANITLADISHRTQYSQSYLSCIFWGKRRPKWAEVYLNQVVDEMIAERKAENEKG